MKRALPRYYVVEVIMPAPQPTRRGRSRTQSSAPTYDPTAPPIQPRYILLGGPYRSRAQALAEHPDPPRILTAYEYDLARHRGRITLPDGSVPPEADNPQVPQWRYGLEVGDDTGKYPERVYRFASRDGRDTWLRAGSPMPWMPGYRTALAPSDPRVVEMRRRVANGEAEWPQL